MYCIGKISNQKLISSVDYASHEHIEPDFFCHEPFCQSSVYVITLYLAYNWNSKIQRLFRMHK